MVVQSSPFAFYALSAALSLQLGTVLLSYFVTQVPAFVAIGLWFVFQLISGLGYLGGGSQQGGVAYAAHIGGFVAGLLLIHVFLIGRRQQYIG